MSQSGKPNLPSAARIVKAYGVPTAIKSTTNALTKLIVDAYARHTSSTELLALRAKGRLPMAFLGELSAALLDMRPSKVQSIAEAVRCQFHEHTSGAACDVAVQSRKRRRISE